MINEADLLCINNTYLTLINEREFYKAFTKILIRAKINEYTYMYIRNEWYILAKEILYKNSTILYNYNNKIKNEIFKMCVSYYSEEVFKQNVHKDQIENFIDNKYKFIILGSKLRVIFLLHIGKSGNTYTRNKYYKIKYIKENSYMFKNDENIINEFPIKNLNNYLWKEITIDQLPEKELDYYEHNPDKNIPSDLRSMILNKNIYLNNINFSSKIDKASDDISNLIMNQFKQETQIKETTMNPQTIIETKVFIFGGDAINLSDDQIFDRISEIEHQISKLEAIKEKPKKLSTKIKKMKEAIAELITYVDER